MILPFFHTFIPLLHQVLVCLLSKQILTITDIAASIVLKQVKLPHTMPAFHGGAGSCPIVMFPMWPTS